jgi:hypothetical protein
MPKPSAASRIARQRAEVIHGLHVVASYRQAASHTLKIKPTDWELIHAECVSRAEAELHYVKNYATQHRRSWAWVLALPDITIGGENA